MTSLSSVSIRVGEKHSASPEIAALEATYGSKLDSLDADGDGKIDRTELLMFVRDVADREKKINLLKTALIGLVVLLVLFALTTFGIVWAVVVLSQKIETSGSDGGLGTALVSSSTGETLRTASGMVVVTPMALNASGAMSLYQNADTQTRRKLLQDGNVSYIAELATQDVIDGCRLLVDGTKDIVTILPVADETNGDGEVTSVSLTEVSIPACRKAIENNNVAGLQAVMFVDALQYNVKVQCLTSESCQVFRLGTLTGSYSETAIGRRRLLGDFGSDLVSLSFGLSSLVCSEDRCAVPEPTYARRALLDDPCPGKCWACSSTCACRDNCCFNDGGEWYVVCIA